MTLSQKLVGTWNLVSAEDLKDGQWIYHFGEHPKGYFYFGADGRVSVQFMNFPVVEKNKTEPLDSYLAYFGRYTVDESAGTFVVNVEAALHPHLVGTIQTRHFRIEGDQLFIGGDSLGFKRTFARAPER